MKASLFSFGFKKLNNTFVFNVASVEIDFSDMINKAIKYVLVGKFNKKKNL
ncbi:MAG: hypothetical protein ACREV6_05975 [Clostridium sp.]|uniref:hypothetical protein n=1 Tax=Clostridium sp. TaxID=1506 RepID=UPI003D6D76F4